MSPTQEQIDAEIERAREEREERAYIHDTQSADSLPDISSFKISYPTKLVREWVRSALVPPLMKRLYDTAMGVQTFDTPTAAGNVVTIEAPPAVQVAAARALIAVGVPTQLGLVDGSDEGIAGVIALGELDLDAARREAHGERYVSPEERARAAAHALPGAVAAPAPAPMAERIAAGEFTVVEVEEGVGATASQDQPPGPIPAHETPEQRILRRRRARRSV